MSLNRRGGDRDRIKPIRLGSFWHFLELGKRQLDLSTSEYCFPIRDDVHVLVYRRRGCFHHQESFTVSSYIQSSPAAVFPNRWLKERSGRASLERGACLDVDRHHGAVLRQIKQLLSILSPVRCTAARRRHSADLRHSRKSSNVDFANARVPGRAEIGGANRFVEIVC